MKPVAPVLPGVDLSEVVFAKDQPQYIPLPAFRSPEGDVTSRWRLTFRERLRILIFGDLWLTVATFGRPLQPVRLQVTPPAELEWLGRKVGIPDAEKKD